MFDLGWTELLLIGIVALIVVGPKELPVLFQTVGRFVGKARAMGREFTQAMNDAADEAGMSEMSRTMRDIANPRAFGTDALRDATGFGPEKTDAEARAEAKARLAAQSAKADADLTRAGDQAGEIAAAAQDRGRAAPDAQPDGAGIAPSQVTAKDPQ